MKRHRLYKVSFWYIVDIEDPDKYDARDATEIAWKFLKVKPSGFEVKPYREKKKRELHSLPIEP